jgi:TFIIF-interacting CTD phosphatase-like protein
MVCLPPKSVEIQKRTLVLDLDETLVHCCVEPIENPDLVFPVTFNGNFYQVYVRKRPHLDRFLEIVSERFEVSSDSNTVRSAKYLIDACVFMCICVSKSFILVG